MTPIQATLAGMKGIIKSVHHEGHEHHEGRKKNVAAENAKEAKNPLGVSPAKAQSRKGDGPKPVIPSECEGSEKDFSLRSK